MTLGEQLDELIDRTLEHKAQAIAGAVDSDPGERSAVHLVMVCLFSAAEAWEETFQVELDVSPHAARTAAACATVALAARIADLLGVFVSEAERRERYSAFKGVFERVCE